MVERRRFGEELLGTAFGFGDDAKAQVRQERIAEHVADRTFGGRLSAHVCLEPLFVLDEDRLELLQIDTPERGCSYRKAIPDVRGVRSQLARLATLVVFALRPKVPSK